MSFTVYADIDIISCSRTRPTHSVSFPSKHAHIGKLCSIFGLHFFTSSMGGLSLSVFFIIKSIPLFDLYQENSDVKGFSSKFYRARYSVAA